MQTEGRFVLEFTLTIPPAVFALILQHFITSSRPEDSYDNIKSNKRQECRRSTERYL